MRFLPQPTIVAALLSLAAAGLATPAAAQQRGQAPAPAAAPQTFGSWERGCERAGRTELCSLRQFVAPKENPRQPIMAVAIGRLTPDRKMTLVIKLPAQIDRNAGIGFRIDDTAVTPIPIQNCDGGACTAAITLDEDLLKRLRAGSQLVVAFRAPQGSAAALPVSLQGLTRGLASLR